MRLIDNFKIIKIRIRKSYFSGQKKRKTVGCTLSVIRIEIFDLSFYIIAGVNIAWSVLFSENFYFLQPNVNNRYQEF